MNITNSAYLGNVELIVTPEQMYQAAGIIENNIRESRNAFDSMLNDIKATTAYWEGDAANKERSRFEGESDNFSALISNLNNYVTELKLITQIYQTGEETSVTEAQSLMADILS